MADLVNRQPEDVGVLQEAGWEDVIARQQVAYAAACENFRILRRKYDALKECHTELLWSRAVVDAEGLGADLAADAPVAEADGVVGGTARPRARAGRVERRLRGAHGRRVALRREAHRQGLREDAPRGADHRRECGASAVRRRRDAGARRHDVDAEILYVVTDLFGEELYGHVRARGLLGPRPRLQVFAGVAAALARMHEAGYAHRDVKPENVLVDFRGDAVEPNHGPLFRCCGSMGFFAPDMLDVRGYDATRTDVWSLGCLGLELALGSRVFADFWFVAYKTFFAAPRGAGDEAGPFRAALAPKLDAVGRASRGEPGGGACEGALPAFSPFGDLVAACLSEAPAARPSAPSARPRAPGPDRARRRAARDDGARLRRHPRPRAQLGAARVVLDAALT
ncbi:serine/threonine kinase [Aureococcus anophagefferens]|nr:serine/threonine kinase [Aureococcus anophagefferens]